MPTPPAQIQENQPGKEYRMSPLPESIGNYKPAGKLQGKIAIITGGDSGIGRATAFCFALEGADVVIVYLNETEDALTTQKIVQEMGRECLCIAGDVGDINFCNSVVEQTIKKFGKLDILVNNAGEQHVQTDFEDITLEQIERTFKTNIFSYMFMAKFALPHLKAGSTIINTASVTAYHGHPKLIDYSATKGAIVSFTRSLAINLAKKKIRVNAVAPGPIWTPLIPASFSEEDVKKFGANTPLERPGQPSEVAPCFVFLACEDSSYMTGQVLHPNGGSIING